MELEMTTSPTELLSRGDPIVSAEALRVFQWINSLLCQVVTLFGIITNIINIICFVKQGFKDSVNISLLALVISDLASLVFLLFTNLCLNPGFQEADLPFVPSEFQYLTTGWPHIVFTRVTNWITALVTLERCLCIIMPLKVRNIITPKRVIVIILCVILVIIGGAVPIYYASSYAFVFDHERNKTIIRLVRNHDRRIVKNISLAINTFLQFTAFVTVIIGTITLVMKLREKSRWRLKCTEPEAVEITSERDQRVSKMVVMISSLFIVCYAPNYAVTITIISEPEFSAKGLYNNTLTMALGLCYLLEATNSSMNIIIYYNMSSKFKANFRQLFAFGKNN